jgi:hypothetical protein
MDNMADKSNRWESLTQHQKVVLLDAWEGSSLVTVLNGISVSTPEAAHWNRKSIHVPATIAAVQYLFHEGLIEVIEGDIQNVLDRVTAAETIARPSNWWSYSPEANWPGNYTPPPDDFDEDETSGEYWLNTTALGDALIASVTSSQWAAFH